MLNFKQRQGLCLHLYKNPKEKIEEMQKREYII